MCTLLSVAVNMARVMAVTRKVESFFKSSEYGNESTL
jgi:hypothetical protein